MAVCIEKQDGLNTDPPIFLCSFFSGAGLLDLGFESEGFEVAFVNEVYAPFLKAYHHARDKMGIQRPRYGSYDGDIADLLGEEKRRITQAVADARQEGAIIGFVGGPPCPDFSVGGKNRGRDGDNGRLSRTYVDLILAQQPDFFVFENVKGLYRTAKHRAFFEELKADLAVDFICTERLINALEYGVPQDRQRIILFGINRERNTDQSLELDWQAQAIYPDQTAFLYPWPKSGEKGHPSNPEDLTVQYWFDKNQVIQHPNARHHFQPRAGLTRFMQVLEGDDSRKSYKRLHRYRYSPTAAYGHNEVHIHPVLPRRISAAEAMAIQSLPEAFELPQDMSLTDMFKTIGNGVPYLAAKGIAAAIKKYFILEGQHYHETNCREPSQSVEVITQKYAV